MEHAVGQQSNRSRYSLGLPSRPVAQYFDTGSDSLENSFRLLSRSKANYGGIVGNGRLT